jgi:hypothetical protein
MNAQRRTLATLAMLVLGIPSLDAQGARDTGEQTKALNLAAYAELLRSDVRTLKTAILTEVMGFTATEDAAFWPIYREYDLELSKLGDERVALIADYASHYESLTDATADQLATRALALEAKRQALKQKYYERVKMALSPRTAMRFLQVEHQLLLLVDLQIAASLPVAPTTRPAAAATGTKGTAGRK